MPIPAIPIVVGILASAGGLSLGALIRQPQINALKAQVTKLQEELGRMQTLCNNVMKDIEILKLRMQMQQNEDLLTQLKGQEDLNIGQLVYAYGLKEYLEIKQGYLIEGKIFQKLKLSLPIPLPCFWTTRLPMMKTVSFKSVSFADIC